MCGLLLVLDDKVSLEQTFKAGLNMAHRGIRSRAIDDLGPKEMHVRLPINALGEEYDQPFVTKDGQMSMMVVGEYYEFDSDRTPSDSVDLCEFLGDCISHNYFVQLRGMYHATVVYNNRVYVFQDKFSKKPVYFRWDIPAIASEIKPLTALGPCTPNEGYYTRISHGRLPLYAETPYTQITRIAPECVFEYNMDTREILWRPYNTPKERVYPLEDILKNALSLRFQADVPVAMLCSGGLDSSILYTMAKQLGKDPLVFHINNEEEHYLDELGITNSVNIDYPKDVLNDIPEILYYNESPLDLGSMLPQYYLGKAIREKDTQHRVVITGDGADEFFCGYQRCRETDTRSYDISEELPIWHLPRLDKLMMAHTLEVRSPYLDERVTTVAEHTSWSAIKGKQPLKNLARDIGVPETIVQRPKKPLKSPWQSGSKESWRKFLIKTFRENYERGLVHEYRRRTN